MEKHVRPRPSSKEKQHMLFNLFLLLLLLIQICSNIAEAGSIVKFLPGYDEGPLPFELETGYIGVDESEDVQLFYYFTKSESNPETDPLVLWLTGGPGCSGFAALSTEIGPIQFEQVQYNGSLPKLLLNPHSWTKVASIIYVDLPVGTGFSYGRTPKASESTELQSCDQAYEFLRKWLVDHHPEFISNPVYVGGMSYPGITVPIVTQLISNGNEIGIYPKIDLKGYLLGNPATTPDDGNYRVPFAHGMGLISDELYQSLKISCRGEYQSIDTSNTLCLQNMQTYNELISDINMEHILEPNLPTCPSSLPKPNKIFDGRRRSTTEMFPSTIQELKIQEYLAAFKCRKELLTVVLSYWAKDESVQEALHVRKGSVRDWVTCNLSLPYTTSVYNTVPYHANLSSKGYRSLIFSGDHDLSLPHFATQAWIKSLNYGIIDDWRQWNLQGQIVGYTRTYANNMTFATIKGAGHIAAEYKPVECQAMFERWISYQPL